MPRRELDFSFDRRVSETYDRVRTHPKDVALKIGQAIAKIAGDDARILELGIGTGRIGLPVAAAGSEVVGVDLSRDMLLHASASAADQGVAEPKPPVPSFSMSAVPGNARSGLPVP